MKMNIGNYHLKLTQPSQQQCFSQGSRIPFQVLTLQGKRGEIVGDFRPTGDVSSHWGRTLCRTSCSLGHFGSVPIGIPAVYMLHDVYILYIIYICIYIYIYVYMASIHVLTYECI